jgi:hypothetical protein
MARNSDTNGRAAARVENSAASTGSPGEGAASGWFGLPVPFPNPVLEFAAQMRRIGEETLHQMGGDVEIETEGVRQARTLQDVQSLQAEFVATEWARLTEWSERVFAGALDAQAAWVKGVEAWTADWIRNGLASHPLVASSGAATICTPAAAPVGWLAAAQAPWAELIGAWQRAIATDLQADPPARAA